MRREERDTAPKSLRTDFDKLSFRWGLVFVDDQITVPTDFRRRLIYILRFGHSKTTNMSFEAEMSWCSEMRKDIGQKVKICTACQATGKNFKYHSPKNQHGKLKIIPGPGQELQIDFSEKLHNKYLTAVPQILIAIDQFCEWPTAEYCETAETKEVVIFLTNHFNLYGTLERTKSKKGAFISSEFKEFCKSRNL